MKGYEHIKLIAGIGVGGQRNLQSRINVGAFFADFLLKRFNLQPLPDTDKYLFWIQLIVSLDFIIRSSWTVRKSWFIEQVQLVQIKLASGSVVLPPIFKSVILNSIFVRTGGNIDSALRFRAKFRFIQIHWWEKTVLTYFKFFIATWTHLGK